MIKAINILTDEELGFHESVDPRWTVAFGHCQETNKMSWLFSKREDGKLEEVYKQLGMYEGRRTIGCGDWAVLV